MPLLTGLEVGMEVEGELSRFRPVGPTLLSIGVFDGVHLGHRHLLTHLVNEASSRNMASGAVTFVNHPRTVVQPGARIDYLNELQERLNLIRSLGVDMVVPLTFSKEVSQLGAKEFLNLLHVYLGGQGLIVGPDFAMGRNREGDIPTLRLLASEMGLSFEVVPVFAMGNNRVSSTLIRRTLANGDVAMAGQMLGKNFCLRGIVSRGEHRGTALGFPTANLVVDDALATPGDGIYATWTYLGKQRYASATSIGVRPTFGAGERTLESYIIDFDGDIYGNEMRLEFVEWLREERTFTDVEQLKNQMSEDVAKAVTSLGLNVGE